jgi:replicative DNA helicase
MSRDRQLAGDDQALARSIPHSLDAERAVLGAVLITSGARWVDVADEVRAEDFYRDAHRRIFRRMAAIHSRDRAIDLVTLRDDLTRAGELEQVGGAAYLAKLVDGVPRSTNVEHYAQILREHALSRESLRIGHQIINDVHAGELEPRAVLDRAEAEILAASNRQSRTTQLQPMSVVVEGLYEELAALVEGKPPEPGIATGFEELDVLLGGLRPGLTLLAGRTSQGKTALALNIAWSAAQATRLPVAIFSLEQDAREVRSRLLVSLADIDGHQLRTGAGLTRWHQQRLVGALSALEESTLHIDASPARTVADIRAESRRLKAHEGLALIVLDYVQLLSGERSDGRRGNWREQEVASFSRGLKALAKELRVPVLGLSQLNRSADGRPDGKPQLSDLRESGALEQDADAVLLIHRPGLYKDDEPKDLAIIQLAKHRDGPTGSVRLRYVKESFRFEGWHEMPRSGSHDLPFAEETR